MRKNLRTSFFYFFLFLTKTVCSADFVLVQGYNSGEYFEGIEVFNDIKLKDLKGLKNNLAQGFDIDMFHPEGYTALMLACCQGNSQIVQEILKMQPNLDLRDKVFKRTALHYAASCDHYEIGEFLVRAGVNPSILDQRGVAARDIASEPEKWVNMESNELALRNDSLRQKQIESLESSIAEVKQSVSDLKELMQKQWEQMRANIRSSKEADSE